MTIKVKQVNVTESFILGKMSRSSAPQQAKLIFFLFLGVLSASSAAIFIRFSQLGNASSIVIATMRLTIATIVLAPYTLFVHRLTLKHLGVRAWALALLSGTFLAFHFIAWITSLEFTTVASSVVLVSTTPIWVAILSPIFLHERINRAAILGLILAMLGGLVIGFSDACIWGSGKFACPTAEELFNKQAFLGDFLALGGAWMAAGYLLVGRKLRADLPLVPYIFIVYGMAALVLMAIMIMLGKTPLGLQPEVYIWLLLLALIPQLLGHSTFNWALKYMPASFVSITLLGEPIGSSILAFFIFQETPGWIKIGGATLLMLGIWLAGKNK